MQHGVTRDSRSRFEPNSVRVYWLLACVGIVGCVNNAPETEAQSSAVVYGEDDRRDVFDFEGDARFQSLASESIVALIDRAAIDASNPADVRLRSAPLGPLRRLCPGERFAEQPTAADCSGTLIDLDLVLTAGHCMASSRACADTRFVFDYLYAADGELSTIDFDEDVYGCTEVVALENNGSLDYAVVRLDRVVDPSHVPAPVRLDDLPLPLDTGLVVLGFGSGVPLKIDDGGRVTNPRAGRLDWFGANLDTFGGNSGSGVFTDDGTLAGVLVRGEGDYTFDGRCSRVRELPESPPAGIEEENTYVARAIDALCAASTSSLCGEAGVCSACRTNADCGGALACSEGACVPPCGAETCGEGSTCEGGFCQPDTTVRCEGSLVVETRCGRTVRNVERCGDGTFCQSGACTPLPRGDRCDTAIEVEVESQRIEGFHIAQTTSASRGTCGGRGRDTVYVFETREPVRFTAAASGPDPVLYLRTACGDPRSEVACDDDGGPRANSLLVVEELPAGTYYLFSDSFSPRTGGRFELNLDFRPLTTPDAGIEDAGIEDAGIEDGSVSDAGDLGVRPMDSGVTFDAALRDAGVSIPDAAPSRDLGTLRDATQPDAGGPYVRGVEFGCSASNNVAGSVLFFMLGLAFVRRRL